MKRLTIAAGLLASALHAQQFQTFDIKVDDWAEGEPPKEVFVVDGTVKVATHDGNKAIVIDPVPITDASAQLGVSASGTASIEARILATKRGRSTPRFGISVHGMSGYRLLVNPAKKTLELSKGDQAVTAVPFTWASGQWLKVKLEVGKEPSGTWSIHGKAWPSDAAEPATPLIKHKDNGLKGQGKCAIWATPFSGEPVFFDDIQVKVETGA